MLGSNLVAQIVFDPSDSICAAKALFSPWMIDTMKITVITPTLTPRIVRDERSLFERTVSMAIQADSFISTKVMLLERGHLCSHEREARKSLSSHRARLGRPEPC